MRSEYVDDDTFRLLVSLCTPENALALRLARETGMRIGDVVRLKGEDIDGRLVRWTAQKTGKSAVAEISPDLARSLSRPAGLYVFEGQHGAAHRSRQAVWKNLKRACSRLGIHHNITPHSARKSFAVDLMKRQGIEAVQEKLQHDRITTSLLYAFADKLTADEKKENEPIGTINDEAIENFAFLVAEKVASLLKKS